MRSSSRTALTITMVIGLAATQSACSGETDPSDPDAGTFLGDVDTLWGGESQKERAERLSRLEQANVKVPVSSVGMVEMGRTRDGFLITATGTAPGLGYSLPRLRPRRSGAPGADGYIEFDFVATPPAEGLNLPPGNTQARAIRADLPVKLADLKGAQGIRILAISGGTQIDF